MFHSVFSHEKFAKSQGKQKLWKLNKMSYCQNRIGSARTLLLEVFSLL